LPHENPILAPDQCLGRQGPDDPHRRRVALVLRAGAQQAWAGNSYRGDVGPRAPRCPSDGRIDFSSCLVVAPQPRDSARLRGWQLTQRPAEDGTPQASPSFQPAERSPHTGATPARRGHPDTSDTPIGLCPGCPAYVGDGLTKVVLFCPPCPTH
jgi:hypothetical protein